jgi:hypothetical protein
MAEQYKTLIYFEDQCRRIGSGWRVVIVEEGEKWAHLTSPVSGARAKMLLDDFDELEQRPL